MSHAEESPPAFTPAHQRLEPTHPFRRYGYAILRPQDGSGFDRIRCRFSDFMLRNLADFSAHNGGLAEVDRADFDLPKYHEFIAKNGIDHHAFVKSISRALPTDWCDDAYVGEMVRSASVYLGFPLRIYSKKIEFRVVRPHALDNNPLHRDHWFPYFIPLINIYLPICGSHCDSALKIVPGSHMWTDEEVIPTFGYDEGRKTIRGGVAYSVPEIKTCTRDMATHRPDILPGDFMIFSPKAVHGGGDNQSLDTRFSFEIRLEPT